MKSFGYRDDHRPSFVLAFIGALALTLALGCTDSTQKKFIDGANAAQQAAADTYNTAVGQQAVADVECAPAFLPTTPRPATPAEKDATCAAIGKPLPFKSLSLQKAAAPINATYDLVRKANEARLAANAKAGDPSLVVDLLSQLGGFVVEAVADLIGAGVPVPQKVTDWTALLKTAGVH
jgi:type II secretory pathway pseudopilin PulG